MSEFDIQRDIFKWASNYRELRLMYATASGLRLTKGLLWKALLSGIIKKGLPDIVLPKARKGYYGLYLELKTEKGRVSEDQSFFIQDLIDEGYLAIVAFGFDEAIRIIKGYVWNQE